MTRRILPVSVRPGAELFLSLRGHPVWPAPTTELLRDLTKLAATFGTQVMPVKGLPGPVRAGRELVVGLGTGVAEATRLYAHLTERQFRFADSLSDIADGPHPSVIVTRTSWVDNELLELASLTGPGRPATGIICSDNYDELLHEALLRSAAASFYADVKVPRIDLYPIKPLGHVVAGGREVLGGKATPSEIKHALEQGAGVVCVNTHADGVDAFLGPQLTLCSMDQRPTDADEQRSPRCQETGVCHRMHVPVEEALASGSLIHPEMISARVLVWNVCSGVLTSDGLVDPAWGFARRLLLSPGLGAIITTWGVVMTDAKGLDRLANDLTNAVPVGKALARMNHSPSARRLGYRMCLLGDPRVRVTSKAQAASRKKENRLLPVHRPAPVNQSLKEVPFLRACLTEEDRDQTMSASVDDLEMNNEVLGAVNNYEQAAWAGRPLEGNANSPGPVMRRTVVTHFSKKRGRLSDDWLRLVADVRASSKPVPCFVCGRITNTLLASLRIPGVARRRLVICPLCGIIEDSPDHARLSLSLENDAAFRLGGLRPSMHWTANLYLASSSTAYSRWYEWPPASDSRPMELFAAPDPWPPGPLRIGVIMMWESSVAVVSMPGRSRPASRMQL